MNTLYYDLIVLAVTIPACFIYNFFLYRNSGYSSKKAFTWLLVFLGMYPLLNMVAHLIAVGTLAILRLHAGVFQYDIKFYTLIQFGILLFIINAYILNQINQISRGNWVVYRNIVLASALQIAIILPLFPFNPISFLPVATSILLILRVVIARRGRSLKKTFHLVNEDYVSSFNSVSNTY